MKRVPLYIVLACCLVSVSCNNGGKDSNVADSAEVVSSDTLQAEMEQQPAEEAHGLTQERAEWLFKQIPDHSSMDKFNSQAFSKDFGKVVTDAFEYDKRMTEQGYLDGEGVYYWYNGNGEPSTLKKISIVSADETKAVVDITMDEYGKTAVHKMYVVYEGGNWVVDNWDENKKDELRKNK